jgi:spore coat polysaccharide biosynthesis protein SpsF
MKVEIFIQARMGSTRLPGKVLKPVLDKPLLFYLTERLARVKEADSFVILTSTKHEDDVIVAFCEKNEIPYFRGPEEDVLARYYHAALARHPDAIVRITADCPLIDPKSVDDVISTYKNEYPKWDYVSNSLQRTFPRGLDTELFSFDALEFAAKNAIDPSEREHVTMYMYNHPERFRLKNVASPINLSQHRWTVDTIEDFELIKLLIQELYPNKPYFQLQDILEVLKQHPEWQKINAHIEQKPMR